jgi:hypothetical protein
MLKGKQGRVMQEMQGNLQKIFVVKDEQAASV